MKVDILTSYLSVYVLMLMFLLLVLCTTSKKLSLVDTKHNVVLVFYRVHFLYHLTGYKYELALVLNGTVPLPDLTQLEQQVFKTFRTPSTSIFTPSPVKTHWSQNSTSSASTKKTMPISRQATPLSPFKTPPPFGSPRAAKDRGTKDHFNYLLLDPRVLERLFPANDMSTLIISDDVIICGDGALNELEKFRVFVESVFYVGKGKNSRSMQHLKDAKDCLTLKKTKVGQ